MSKALLRLLRARQLRASLAATLLAAGAVGPPADGLDLTAGGGLFRYSDVGCDNIRHTVREPVGYGAASYKHESGFGAAAEASVARPAQDGVRERPRALAAVRAGYHWTYLGGEVGAAAMFADKVRFGPSATLWGGLPGLAYLEASLFSGPWIMSKRTVPLQLSLGHVGQWGSVAAGVGSHGLLLDLAGNVGGGLRLGFSGRWQPRLETQGNDGWSAIGTLSWNVGGI